MKAPVGRSLRAKLVLSSVLLLVVMLAALAANSLRLEEEALIQQAQLRARILAPMLNAALAAPLAQRDYATLRQILRESRTEDGLSYLVLLDEHNHVIAAEGWDAGQPLPAVEDIESRADFKSDGRFDTQIPIKLGNRRYGLLRFALSTSFLDSARAGLLHGSLIIAGAAIVISIVLQFALGLWLTRHLRRLTAAGEAMAGGDLSARVAVESDDEVGQLAAAFNTMAEAVADRMRELRASEAKFHAIADYSYGCELWIGPKEQLLWINSRVETITGYTVDECHAMPDFPLPLVSPQDWKKVREAIAGALHGTTGNDFLFRARRKDRSEFWASADWRPIFGSDQTYLGLRLSVHDVTGRQEAENKLSETLRQLERANAIQKEYLVLASDERARLNALLNAMQIGILFVDRNNRVIYSNPAFEQIWLLTRSKTRFTGMDAAALLLQTTERLSRGDQALQDLLRLANEGQPAPPVELEMSDGRLITRVGYPVRDSAEQMVGYLWLFEDVTRERQTANQILYLAERDALTGLFNRHRFQEELTRMLSSGERRRRRVALLFFDIDEFKHVNDTFGHRAGDALLIRSAGEVSAQVRRNEIFARLGGDEFGILAPDISDQEAESFAERIVRAIARIPFSFEGNSLRLTCSLGVAVYPDHATTAEDLVAHADAAMYQAKEAGKNTWRMYREDAQTTRKMLARLNWNERIEDALEHDLLRLHYQGIFYCGSGERSHVEALVRMIDRDDAGRVVMPGTFIPVAEKTGKILDIDRWVINACASTLARFPALRAIALNVSGRSLNEPTLPRFISDALRLARVEPERLIVELTETSAVSDLHDAQRFIESMRENGVRVCLDDFGSGFSSFAYLKHLDVDMLKIDGQFIRDLPSDRDNQVFVKAIVDVARGLKKLTVAECVEDGATLEVLRSFGVDLAQGYHLEEPMAQHPALRKA
ncbi:MAG TPA: EAL domain-containing protein [Burkholderiales bacterium]|nr:EAL domain-containing protein [Burkholderiales bacterium]